MSLIKSIQNRDTVLYVDEFSQADARAVKEYSRIVGRKIRVLIISNKKFNKVNIAESKGVVKHIRVNLDSTKALAEALKPYKSRLLAALCKPERYLRDFQKIIPHVPYVMTPTPQSLEWTTDKIMMRRLIDTVNTKLNPRFMVVSDGTQATIDNVAKKIGFPLMVKPAGLAASLLVQVCYHKDELEVSLKSTIKKVSNEYKKRNRTDTPQILVEQMMEGPMYSIDSYVTARGNTYHCPPVHVKTGRAIGFDDFFGYEQLTPVKLKKHKVEIAERVVDQTILALGLRNTTCHTELKKTEEGWKIIEITARRGGFRDDLYRMTYGINHALNDLLIRIPQRPIMPKKQLGYAVAMKFFARKEGTLEKITGIRKLRTLQSFESIELRKKSGDECTFARNGGESVFNILMFNPIRSNLLADIRRLEKMVDIKVNPKGSKKKSL